MPFESQKYELSELMKSIRKGTIQLPDFQREWKWDDDRIKSLLASISLGYPVGILMMLEVGGGDIDLAAKPLAGAEHYATQDPGRLLLDGQQRMTSLYQALASGQPVQTNDGRRRRLSRWYYIDIDKALADPGDREEAIISVPDDHKLKKDFGKVIEKDLSTLDKQCEEEMFPLSGVFDSAITNEWMMRYAQRDPNRTSERLDRWNLYQKTVLANITDYDIPVIVLNKETPKDAVCTVFEKVNTGGVSLNVFELLTASFAAQNFRLKDDWEKHRNRLRKHSVTQKLDSSDFLQAICLLVTRERKQKWPSAESGAPGISCKRRDILRLTRDDYERWAGPAADGFSWAASFLSQEGIYTASDVPYRTHLVPLAAIAATLGNRTDNHGSMARIRQWFWCGVLGELYGSAVETRFARDLEQVVDWVDNRGDAPSTITAASFNSSRLLTLRTRNSAAYKGLYALLMRDGCLDWQKAQQITYASFFDYRVDIHHIFPRAWCNDPKNEISANRRDCIVNKTAISRSTNQSIGGRAPSKYVPTLQHKAGISAHQLDEILATHAVDPEALRADDFYRFFEDRRQRLLDIIESAMGKPPNIDDDILESELSSFEPEPDDTWDDVDSVAA